VRGAPLFGSAFRPAVPLPVPEPAVTVIQDALLVAVHAQVGPVVTPTLTDPPAEPMVSLAGERVNPHGGITRTPFRLT
jgi:hypothetical protein